MFAGDLGFRVFKLDSSNIHAWDPHPDDLAASHAAYLRHAGGQAGTHEHLYRVRAHDGG